MKTRGVLVGTGANWQRFTRKQRAKPGRLFSLSFSHSFSPKSPTMVARLFATSSRTALKAAKANLALNRGLATAAPAVGKVKYVNFCTLKKKKKKKAIQIKG